MNEVELLVHGREVTLEQQKAVHARVIWYVPCTCKYALCSWQCRGSLVIFSVMLARSVMR